MSVLGLTESEQRAMQRARMIKTLKSAGVPYFDTDSNNRLRERIKENGLKEARKPYASSKPLTSSAFGGTRSDVPEPEIKKKPAVDHTHPFESLKVGESMQVRRRFSEKLGSSLRQAATKIRKRRGWSVRDFRIRVAEDPLDSSMTRVWRTAE